LTTFPNTEKRVENTEYFSSWKYRAFLMNFKVFGNVVKHCLECLIYLLNQNQN